MAMGDGTHMLPIKAEVRKAIGKEAGQRVTIRLIKRVIADKLFIVGGSGDPFNRSLSDARVLRTFALEFGLTDEQVLTEEVSRNTYESAVKATEILRTGHYRDLVLVTTALHMPRAAATFHKQGLFPDLYPVDFQSAREGITVLHLFPSTRTLDVMTYAVHELVGLVMYHLQATSNTLVLSQAGEGRARCPLRCLAERVPEHPSRRAPV